MRLTQFGRALHALNIDIICANSSQAKGRVEQAHKTWNEMPLSDRPRKEWSPSRSRFRRCPDPRRNLRQRRDRRDFVEADFETHAEECRRFAILNIPRNLFSEASGTAARRSSTRSLKTAWIAKRHSGSSAQHVSDGQAEILDCPRASSTPLWSNLPLQAQRELCLAHPEAPFPIRERRTASQKA